MPVLAALVAELALPRPVCASADDKPSEFEFESTPLVAGTLPVRAGTALVVTQVSTRLIPESTQRETASLFPAFSSCITVAVVSTVKAPIATTNPVSSRLLNWQPPLSVPV